VPTAVPSQLDARQADDGGELARAQHWRHCSRSRNASDPSTRTRPFRPCPGTWYLAMAGTAMAEVVRLIRLWGLTPQLWDIG
jgi:hypothetical protein